MFYPDTPQGLEAIMECLKQQMSHDRGWHWPLPYDHVGEHGAVFMLGITHQGHTYYAGDIITGYVCDELGHNDHDWTIEKPGVVVWDDEASGLYPFIKLTCWRTDLENLAVLGNIYEHPHLMKK
jgi:hypothetical protein